MAVSSHTPEGHPNRCPVCRKAVRLEPSLPFGDAPCPHCGRLLWFLRLGAGDLYYTREQGEVVRERLIARLAGLVGAPEDRVRPLLEDPRPEGLADLGADSLDLVELIMELEEEGFPLQPD